MLFLRNAGRLIVLLSFKANNFDESVNLFSKQLCMHIAAADPISLDVEALDSEIIDRERSIYLEQLKSSGKQEYH